MWLVGPIAVIGFIVSVVVHFSTFFGINLVQQFPLLWGLHALAILTFMATIFRIQQRSGKGFNRRLKWGELMAPFSMPARALILVTGVYVGINFAMFMSQSINGPSNVSKDGDTYYAVYKKRGPAVECTKEVYDQFNLGMVRGFSGHWMIFLLLPSLYFASPRPRRIS